MNIPLRRFTVTALISIVALGAGRTYHRVPLAHVGGSQWTHVSTIGTVIYIRKQADGDWHLTLMDPPAPEKLIAEIIPAIPFPVPRKGQRIRVWGIARTDREHQWVEIHPVEGWVLEP